MIGEVPGLEEGNIFKDRKALHDAGESCWDGIDNDFDRKIDHLDEGCLADA